MDGNDGLFERVTRRARRVPAAIGYFHAPRYASALRKRWVLFRNPHVNISFGRHCYLGPGFSIDAPQGGTFLVGDRVSFKRNFRADLAGPDSRITIGDGTLVTYDVLLQCVSSIEIGARCILAQSVLVVDASHRFRDLNLPVLEQGQEIRPIRIGDDAAVMSKSTVLASVGERGFVAAGAVVTRPIAPHTLAAGVPAQEVENFGPAA
jgi:acetyltransferase-like isoleucine patch superfamily enzyme